MKNNNIKTAIAEERPFFMSVPAFVWQVLFLYVPLFFIISFSFIRSFDLSIFKSITFEHYGALLHWSYFKVIGRSLMLAFFTGAVSLFVAYPVAYFLAFKARRWKNLLLFFLVLPFWANFLVQVYAWFFIFERHGVLNSLLLKIGIIAQPLAILNTSIAIHIVMLFCYLPFMVLPIYTSLEKIDHFTLEASSDLGATPFQTLRNITIPLSMLGVRNGFFLVFIPSFGEFVIPSLLGGGKTMFVGSMISYLFLESKNTFVGSAFTCISMLVLVVASFLVYLLFRKIAR